MLESKYEDIQIKVDRFLSSDGIDGLGDQPFVSIFNIVHVHVHIYTHKMCEMFINNFAGPRI